MARTIICFDLDGTLANTFDAHIRAYNFAFQKNNLPTKTYRDIISNFGDTAEHIIMKLFPKLSDRKLPAVVKDKVDFFNRDTFKLVKPIEGAAEALDLLKERHVLALVSGSTHREIMLTLKEVGIPAKVFDIILGKGEFEPKPSPDAVKKIEGKLGLKVEYVVGDTVYDIKTGRSAGAKTVAVLSGAENVKMLGSENPTMIIKSVAVLPEILEGEL